MMQPFQHSLMMTQHAHMGDLHRQNALYYADKAKLHRQQAMMAPWHSRWLHQAKASKYDQISQRHNRRADRHYERHGTHQMKHDLMTQQHLMAARQEEMRAARARAPQYYRKGFFM